MKDPSPVLLLVDDHTDNLFVLRHLIEEHLPSCQIHIAESAAAGLEVASRVSLDGALIDMQMPGMDGIEMCRRLKNQKATAHLPVVLITSHRSTSGLRTKGIESGADDFIIRPIDNIELIARIKAMLRIKKAEDRLRNLNSELEKQVHDQTQALRDYQKAFECCDDLLATCDRDYRYTLANPAFLKYLGLNREAVVGQPIAGVVGASLFAQEIKPHMDRCLNGEHVEFEKRLSLAGKGTRHLLSRFSPIRNADGYIEGTVVLLKDITERKQTEEAIRESRALFQSLSQQLRTLLDGIPNPLMLLDPELTVIWANRATSAYLQREITTLPGKTCRSLWQKHCICCDDCPIIKCFESGKPEEVKFRSSDGRIWDSMAFPLKDEKAKVVNVISMDIEITEKLKLREEANRASRLASLGELSAGIAHEINNPNALILLNAPLLMNSWPDIARILDDHHVRQGDFLLGRMNYSKMRHEMPRLHAGIQDSAKRIKRIVEDLKNFVRAEGSDAFEAITLNAPVQTAVRLAASTIHKSTEHFTTRYSEEMPQVKGSLQGVEQVVVNLLVNACQALPDQERGISLTTRFEAQSGMNVIEICDEGVGIESRDLPHITDPFFTTRREHGGTGLGLSVSARIAREHNGSLEFISQPGKGTTAIFRLPIAP